LAKIGEQDASGRQWHRAIAFNAGKTCGSVDKPAAQGAHQGASMHHSQHVCGETGPKVFISLSSTFHVWNPHSGNGTPKVEVCAEGKMPLMKSCLLLSEIATVCSIVQYLLK